MKKKFDLSHEQTKLKSWGRILREILLKEPVELKLPAEQNMMLVMRLTTAGVVARAGLTVDRMDDVKMAVEEACNCLIGGESAPRQLCLRFAAEDGFLKIRVCGDGACTGAANADELGVARCILESLVDGVEMCMHGDVIGAVELRISLDL